MNNNILIHLRSTIPQYPGNYLEIGSESGSRLTVLAREFPEKTIISIDGDPANFETIYKEIAKFTNVMFYDTTVAEFTSTLSDNTADTMAVDTVLINLPKDYADSAEAVKLAVKLLSNEPGQVLFANCDNENISAAIVEFKYLIGYRIIDTLSLDTTTLVFKVREY